MNLRMAACLVGAVVMLAACGSEYGADPAAATRDGTAIAPVTKSSGTCPGCTTRITYALRTPDGSDPTDAETEQARQAIDDRLAEFGIDHTAAAAGTTIVATLKNDDGTNADEFGQTPKMYIRPVLDSVSAIRAPGESEPSPSALPSTAVTVPAPTGSVIQDARAIRQSRDPQIQARAAASLDCKQPDPLKGKDDPELPLVTCSDDGTEIYLLDKSRLDGTEIQKATSETNQNQQVAVSITFKPDGAHTWADLTRNYIQKQLAFTLDTTVVSAPVVQQGPQLDGTTQITGQFTTSTAQALARTIRRATVPLSAVPVAKEVLRPTK